LKNVKIGFVPSHRVMFRDDISCDMRNRILKVLSSIEGLEVVVPDEKLARNGLVRDDEDAEKTIELFKQVKVKGIIIGAMNFGDEISAVSVASAFPKCPKLLFAVKEEPTVTGRDRRDSFCGTLSIASGLHRRNLPFLFAGVCLPEEPAFKDSALNFVHVCNVVDGFRGAKIGLVGPRPERFETCAFNEVALLKEFEQRVVPVSSADIFFAANEIPENDSELQETIREIGSQSETSSLGKGVLEKMAKLECALRRFAKERKLAGMGIRCWPTTIRSYGVLPCHTMGRLTDQGVMSSCEADVYGALSMVLQYLVTLQSSIPHFIDWTVQHPTLKDVFLAWHCGNAPPTLACEGYKVQVTSIGQGSFKLKTGMVTICRLVEYDGMFKLLVTKGEVIADEPVPQTGSWVKVPDLDKLYRTLVEGGFVHHASMIHGDYTQALSDACKFLGIETVMVYEEKKWNRQ
jgi:L-fucose isomerase-like protein